MVYRVILKPNVRLVPPLMLCVKGVSHRARLSGVNVLPEVFMPDANNRGVTRRDFFPPDQYVEKIFFFRQKRKKAKIGGATAQKAV